MQNPTQMVLTDIEPHHDAQKALRVLAVTMCGAGSAGDTLALGPAGPSFNSMRNNKKAAHSDKIVLYAAVLFKEGVFCFYELLCPSLYPYFLLT